jgi:hypothetical protein
MVLGGIPRGGTSSLTVVGNRANLCGTRDPEM